MDQQRDTRRIGLKIASVFFAMLLVLSLALFTATLWEQKNASNEPASNELDTVRFYNGTKYVLNTQVETLLVLGLDTFESDTPESFNNNKQADFLLLLVMDKASGTCKAIHINRDTMVETNVLGVAGEIIDTTPPQQIALAHTYGNGREVSCRNVANAVTTLLGVPVDHYVSVTMDAVSVFNDLVGGVTVEVLEDFSQIDPTLVQGQTITLTGAQALTYVRSRQGLADPTNTQRMKRQKQYLEALYEQSRYCMQTEEGFVSRAALAMADYIVSDCSGNKLETVLSYYAEHKLATVHNLDGESKAGEKFMEFYPDADSIEAIVIDCFYQKAG